MNRSNLDRPRAGVAGRHNGWERGGGPARTELSRLVKPRRAAELVAAHLRAEIVGGTRAFGATLPVERELVEAYGVSRPTLREALRILETEGLLEVTRGAKGGARVIGPSLTLASHAVGMLLQAQHTSLADVQAARQIIEPPAARMVAERHCADDLAALGWALEAERVSVGTPEFPFAAMRFHELLIERSGNNTLSAFLMVLHDIHEGVASMLSSGRHDAGIESRALQFHEKLLARVEVGDGPGAEHLWREYWAWIVPYTRADSTAVVDVLSPSGGTRD